MTATVNAGWIVVEMEHWGICSGFMTTLFAKPFTTFAKVTSGLVMGIPAEVEIDSLIAADGPRADAFARRFVMRRVNVGVTATLPETKSAPGGSIGTLKNVI